MEPLKIEDLIQLPLQVFYILLAFVLDLIAAPCNLIRRLLTLFIEGILAPLSKATEKLHAKVRGQVSFHAVGE